MLRPCSRGRLPVTSRNLAIRIFLAGCKGNNYVDLKAEAPALVCEVNSMQTKEGNPLVWLAALLILGVGLTGLLAVLFIPFYRGYGMMGWGMGWGMVFMVVPALFFILLLVAALGALAPRPTYVPLPSALETLDARYARGEVPREEYLRMRAELEGGDRLGGAR